MYDSNTRTIRNTCTAFGFSACVLLRNYCRFDEAIDAFAVSLPSGGSAPGTSRPLPPDADPRPAGAAEAAAAGYRAAQQRSFHLDPFVVRENDTSATAIDEWTGERVVAQARLQIRPPVEPAHHLFVYLFKQQTQTCQKFRYSFMTLLLQRISNADTHTHCDISPSKAMCADDRRGIPLLFSKVVGAFGNTS